MSFCKSNLKRMLLLHVVYIYLLLKCVHSFPLIREARILQPSQITSNTLSESFRECKQSVIFPSYVNHRSMLREFSSRSVEEPRMLDSVNDNGGINKFSLNQMGNAFIGIILVGSVFWGITSGNVEEMSVTESVIEVIAPQSATDVIAVSLGEGLGGLVGAGATSWLSGGGKSSLAATTDYFITRAAALPLFLSLGFDSLAASILATFLASVPYEAVKYQARNNQRARKEKQLLDELLFEEEQRKKRNKGSMLSMPFMKPKEQRLLSVNVTQLEDAVLPNKFDAPEVISDVLIWLEYAVLDSNFGDMLFFPSFPVMVQPAIFGALAALSSQLYLDALYRFTDWGPEEKSLNARTRTIKDVFAGYGSAMLNSATLFGVYELVRKPTGMIITNLLSGGLEVCVGSADYDMCIETFEFDYVFSSLSATPPTLPAEVRALIVAIFSLIQRVLGNFSLSI